MRAWSILAHRLWSRPYSHRIRGVRGSRTIAGVLSLAVGLWPIAAAGPTFYAYIYPEPAGFKVARVGPPAARYDDNAGEFLLPYDAVRGSADPDASLREFLQSAYDAAASLGGCDRVALEPVEQPPRHPTRAWSRGS